MRLGILTSHPIQYQAPWFRALAKIVDLEVFFAHRQSAAEQGKAGFGVAFDWDVDLLCGYRHQFLKNVASRPGVDHFFGCDTPEVAEIIERLRDNGSQDYEQGGPQDCGPRTTDQGTTCGQRSMASGQWSVVHGPSFDAFIVTGWHLKSYWQAVRACRRAGVPVLVRGDSQLHTPRSLLKRWAKELVHRVLLRQFAGFLTVGKRNREYLEHYGVPPEKIFFAPHFVDNEWFGGKAEIARKQKAEIRKEWGADDQALVALFVGKFQPIKRPLDLVEAASLLLEDRSSKREDRVSDSVSQLPTPLAPLRSLHLLFVGSGELEKELRAACDVRFDAEGASRDHATTDQGTTHHGRETADCGTNGSRLVVSGPVVRGQPTTVRPRATFAGFRNQSELPAYYAAADLIVLPSESETWGLAVNEAMACGLPAIVSDAAGCAADLIEEGRTGFTFPVRDCAQLARRLESLADMKKSGHDFAPALAEKLRAYSAEAAVRGTVRAMKMIRRGQRQHRTTDNKTTS